ncbi:hypothetical protein CHX26_14120 [Porphyrobacter sp. HT-58-2]|nr:hypothetical protein CHX26_14120 [Porphyrobacter sp. HT-58-2]
MATIGGEQSLFLDPLDKIQNEEIATLRSQIDTLKGDVYSEGEPLTPIDSTRVIAIEDRQKALDEALSQSADRVIALATMRNDIDTIEERQKEQVGALQQQVSELRTILLSLVGSIVAILLAFVGWLGLRKKSSSND